MGKLKVRRLKEEHGVALVLGMLLLLILTLIGISALNTSNYDILISGNEKASVQAFYIAEAGINEFTGRFRPDATNQIPDSDPSNPNWEVLLAKYPGRGATQIGFVSGDPNSILSLQDQLDFGVETKHKTDAGNQVVQYAGVPIYLLKSYGFTVDGGNKVLELELKRSPDYDPPAALYSSMPVFIRGSSTYINGNDGCGTRNKPGIVTITTTIPPITETGNPTINGFPPQVTLGSNPPPMNLPIKEMIDYLRGDADFEYNYDGDRTLTGYSDDWGNPSSNGTGAPVTYVGTMHIVYFNMNGDRTLKLTGDSHGAGILLVEGNLEISGGFTWYGIILATGTVNYTGSGKANVTGGIISGGNIQMDVGIGGNLEIISCSSVSNKLRDIIPPLKITRWREIF